MWLKALFNNKGTLMRYWFIFFCIFFIFQLLQDILSFQMNIEFPFFQLRDEMTSMGLFTFYKYLISGVLTAAIYMTQKKLGKTITNKRAKSN